MSQRYILPIVVAFLVVILHAYGDDKPDGNVRQRLADDNEQLLKDCKDLAQKLQALSVRLENSERIEDRDRVVLLKKALAALTTTKLESRLQESLTRLRSDKSISTSDITALAQQQKAAADELGGLVALFTAEDRELAVARMVQGYGRQMDALQDALRRQRDACIAAENKNANVADLQKAADAAAKAVETLAEIKAIPCDCPDRCNLCRSMTEARKLQDQVDTELTDGKLDAALDHQRKAIAVMKSAEDRLSEQFAQVRLEQTERLLSTMQSRCQRMIDMQTTVRNGTVSISNELNEGADKAGSVEKILFLADDQDKVALEAHRATRLLEDEASMLALPEVFYQLRKDMISAGNRLRNLDVGVITQSIQQDVLDTLRETTETIKKARRPVETAPPGGAGSGSSSSSASVTKDSGSSRGSGFPLVHAMALPRYYIDPAAEAKLVRGQLNRGNQRIDSMTDGEKQEFESWKKRLPDVDDIKPKLSKKDLDKERKDAHFRELTCALEVWKTQLTGSERSEDRDRIDMVKRVLEFADDLKPDEDRPAKLLAFLISQKGFKPEDFKRQSRSNKTLAEVFTAVTHRLEEERAVREQADWHDITLRTRDAQERLQKQAALLKQLEK